MANKMVTHNADNASTNISNTFQIDTIYFQYFQIIK